MYIAIELLARLLLVLGGINFLTTATANVNLLSFLKNHFAMRAVSFAIGISALYFMFNRDYYLPFLGTCVIPVGPAKPSDNLKQITLSKLPPNTQVIYWGAKSGETSTSNPLDAYGDYANSGIAKTDATGTVVVELQCPREYTVSKFMIMNQVIPRHMHYRYELPKYKGLFSRVYTKTLDC
jgi:uncharacterized membrane protein YuzA (DUF378 family)